MKIVQKSKLERRVQSGRTVVLMALMLLLGISGSAIAANKTYHFGVVAGGMDLSQRSYITFESQADVETIHGTTNQLVGVVTADLKKGTAKINLEVSVSSLRTGIDLRDQHLRSTMWLDAEKHPKITFVSKSIKKVSKKQWKIRGTFTLHGVSKEMVVTADVREIPKDLAQKSGLGQGEWIKVSIPFKVVLSEFGVRVPKKLAARVNDTWDVRLMAFASTDPGKKAVATLNPCDPCNPCGGKKAMNPCNPCGGKKTENPCNPCNPCG